MHQTPLVTVAVKVAVIAVKQKPGLSQASEVVRHRGIGAAATPDGGSWLVAADRGMFGFGDAQFQGSVAGVGIAGQAVGGAARPV